MNLDKVSKLPAGPREPAPHKEPGDRLRHAATTAAVMTLAVATIAISIPAHGQQPGPFRRAERPGAPAGNGLAPRQADQRGDTLPSRQAGYANPMSPEERRQLRRDIDEHGRDLYKERREPR